MMFSHKQMRFCSSQRADSSVEIANNIVQLNRDLEIQQVPAHSPPIFAPTETAASPTPTGW